MKNLALLVVDMQNGLINEKPLDVDIIINNIELLINKCRERNVEVIYVQHNGPIGDGLEVNSDGWQIHNKISPKHGEKVITKNYNSSFRQTELNDYLKSRDINKLIIVGMQTEYCIDTTIKVAFEYGFEVIIPKKTNTTFNNENISAKEIYEYYNYDIFNNRFVILEDLEKIIEKYLK